MRLRYVAAAKTDVGQKRQGNEDRFCLDPALGLYVVADGMGGHAAGEVASRLAVETIQEWMEKYRNGADAAIVGPAAGAGSAEANCLLSSIRLANRVIFDSAKDRPEYAGMGTTVVAVLTTGLCWPMSATAASTGSVGTRSSRSPGTTPSCSSRWITAGCRQRRRTSPSIGT